MKFLMFMYEHRNSIKRSHFHCVYLWMHMRAKQGMVGIFKSWMTCWKAVCNTGVMYDGLLVLPTLYSYLLDPTPIVYEEAVRNLCRLKLFIVQWLTLRELFLFKI